LAELHLAGHRGAIVFDDPVSSLDHYWRKNVARRLAEEAKSRQVILLTHDSAFLGELRDVIEQQDLKHLIHHLEWVGDRPGNVFAGLPWIHQSYKERLETLRQKQKLIEKTWPIYPTAEDTARMSREYSRLRATIERVIQDVVLGGVVQRYRDWVRVDRLDEVVGFTAAECKEIARLHKACSDATEAHDPSSAKNSNVPNAQQLGKDIADVTAVAEAIKARRKQVPVSKALSTST
jgi:ATPase subunit of ABC transporter with duplicated ATPase domains